MTHTLVVYSIVPECTEFFLIPNEEITPEQSSLLALAHGKFINSDDINEGMRFLQSALAEQAEHCAEDAPIEWQCIFRRYVVDVVPETPLTAQSIDRVIYFGFML